MKKVIPEVVEHYCDKCEKEINGMNTDATGKISYVCRDVYGHPCGGISVEIELCPSCTRALRAFLEVAVVI